MKAVTRKWAGTLLLTAAMVALGGCGKNKDVEIPAYALDLDSDSETETETEESGPGDECPEAYLDDKGRCIRYVDFESDGTDCGYNWNTAFDEIQPAIDSAYTAAIQLGHCEVWVAAGTYYSFSNSASDSVRLKPNVSVYGGFAGDEEWLTERDIEANVTIIDGREQGGEDASYHVVMGSNDADLDGFTITGGRALADPPHHRGGGIYLNAANTHVLNCKITGNEAFDGGGVFTYDSWPIVENSLIASNRAQRGGGMLTLNGFAHLSDVRFENNLAEESGGGLYFERVYSACYPVLENIEFVDNTASIDGGAVYNISCNPTIDGALIESNTVGERGGGVATYRGSFDLSNALLVNNRAPLDGGGVYSKFTDTTISYCDFEANLALGDAGGVYLELTEGTIYASTFVQNSAGNDGGAITVYFDDPRVLNTLITGNRSNRGAGIFNGTRAETEVVNCTLHGNVAAEDGGGLYNADLSEPEIYNSILWQNESKQIYDEIGSEVIVGYSDVQYGYPGIFNIDADPLFAAPGSWDDNGTPLDNSDDSWIEGDYHLLEWSPCIDMADDSVSPEMDAEGKAWADLEDTGLPDIATDMGIFDFQP
jgi:predicted outer membrane repeat protein